MRGPLLHLLLLALFGASCAGALWRPPIGDPVQLQTASAAFPSEGRGEFRLGLQLPKPKNSPGRLTGIDWELRLNNRWFASGTGLLDQEIPPNGGVVQITLPVAFERLPTSSAPVSLKLSARGKLRGRFGGSEEELTFSGNSIVQAANAPLLESAETD